MFNLFLTLPCVTRKRSELRCTPGFLERMLDDKENMAHFGFLWQCFVITAGYIQVGDSATLTLVFILSNESAASLRGDKSLELDLQLEIGG